MSKCSECRKAFKASEKELATCSRATCAKQYHPGCVNLTVDAFKKCPTWVCPMCVCKHPKSGDNSSMPVKLSLVLPVEESGRSNVTVKRGTPTPTSPKVGVDIPQASPSDTAGTEEAIAKVVRKEVTTALKDVTGVQFQALGERLVSLETSVKYLSNQCDDMFRYYSETKAEMAVILDENKQLRQELCDIKNRTKMIEDGQARQEQWARAQNIEVIGVPETKDESAVELIIKVAAQTGVKLQSSEIEFAHRVQPRRPASAGASRAIVARFRQRSTKDAVVAASRKHRNITSKELGMGGEIKKIYVNEHLTKENKQLLKLCKEKSSQYHYKYVWTKNCRIYMRKTDTSPPFPILSLQDLDKIK